MTARLHALLPPDSVRRVRLPNGLTILARRDTTAPVVAIVTWVKAGYFDEPDDAVGIAHVLEHMYFKGTPTRGVGAIARETKAAGGYLNAGTIYDHTHYYTVLPASGFVAGLEVQAEPRIVETVLGLLETVAGAKRRPLAETHGVDQHQMAAAQIGR